VLKVKAHHSREQHQQEEQQHPAGQPEVQQQAERDHKRPRIDSSSGEAASAPATAAAANAAVKESSAVAEASCSVPVQQGVNHATAPSNTATCSSAIASTQQSAQMQQQGEAQGNQEEHHGGLEGLLGYSSESDAEDDAKPGNNACQVASIPQQGLKLPSAAELLEQDMPSSFAPDPGAREAEADTPVPVVGSAAMYQHHSGWI
jgi:hypothetical protein